MLGQEVAEAMAAHGLHLEVVRQPEARRGSVLLPRRWVVERLFAWLARVHRLARDDERLSTVLAGLHVIAFACLLLHRVIAPKLSSSHALGQCWRLGLGLGSTSPPNS